MSWLGLGLFVIGFIVSAATDGEAGAVAGVLMFAGFLIGVYGLVTRKRASKRAAPAKSVQSIQNEALAQQRQHAADIAQAEANAKAAAEQRRRDAIARAHQRANADDDIEWG